MLVSFSIITLLYFNVILCFFLIFTPPQFLLFIDISLRFLFFSCLVVTAFDFSSLIYFFVLFYLFRYSYHCQDDDTAKPRC